MLWRRNETRHNYNNQGENDFTPDIQMIIDEFQHLLILRSLHLLHCFLCVSAPLQSLGLWTMWCSWLALFFWIFKSKQVADHQPAEAPSPEYCVWTTHGPGYPGRAESRQRWRSARRWCTRHVRTGRSCTGCSWAAPRPWACQGGEAERCPPPPACSEGGRTVWHRIRLECKLEPFVNLLTNSISKINPSFIVNICLEMILKTTSDTRGRNVEIFD